MDAESTSILTRIKQLLNVKMNMLIYSHKSNERTLLLVLAEVTFALKFLQLPVHVLSPVFTIQITASLLLSAHTIKRQGNKPDYVMQLNNTCLW